MLKGCTCNDFQNKGHERYYLKKNVNEIMRKLFFGLSSVKALYTQATPFKQEQSKIVSKCSLS